MNDSPEKRIASSPIRQSPGSLAPLYKALAKAQGEYPVIEKTHLAKVTGKDPPYKLLYTYTYADLADIMGPTRPVLAKYGLSVQHHPIIRDGWMFAVCRLAHETGAWVESDYPVSGIGGAPINHQTLGGALAYAKRQSYCAVTGIVAEEEGDETDVEDGKEVPSGNRQAEPERKAAASPPRRSPPKQEGVAFITTQDDREKLRGLGFKDTDIAGMKPETAKAFIRTGQKKTDDAPHPLLAEMLRMTTPESLKQWHADASDRIMAEPDEWRDGTFYPRYDDHMATLKAKA